MYQWFHSRFCICVGVGCEKHAVIVCNNDKMHSDFIIIKMKKLLLWNTALWCLLKCSVQVFWVMESHCAMSSVDSMLRYFSALITELTVFLLSQSYLQGFALIVIIIKNFSTHIKVRAVNSQVPYYPATTKINTSPYSVPHPTSQTLPSPMDYFLSKCIISLVNMLKEYIVQ